MAQRERTKHDLMCFCPRKPLLAVYGIMDGKRYVHLMVKRHSRIHAEMLVTEGTSNVFIRCRECARLHKVSFPDSGAPRLEEVPPTTSND